MKTNTNFVLLNGDINHTSKDVHNRAFKFSVYSKDDLEIKMLKAEIEKKNKEIEKFKDENKTLKEELEEKTVECIEKTVECEIKDGMFEEVMEKLEEKVKECEAKEEENKGLKSENKKLNEIVVAGKTELALRDETINKILSEPKVRRLNTFKVKDIIDVLIDTGERLTKNDVLMLASKYNVTVKTIINLYTRKTHAKAWSMLDINKLWVIKQDIVNLV